MLFLFQGLIVMLVTFSDIRWGWIDNTLASGFIGVVLASFLTLWWIRWQDREYERPKPDRIEGSPPVKKWGFLYLAVPVGVLMAMTIYAEYFMD